MLLLVIGYIINPNHTLERAKLQMSISAIYYARKQVKQKPLEASPIRTKSWCNSL